MTSDFKIESGTLFEVIETVFKTMAKISPVPSAPASSSGPIATGIISMTGDRRLILVVGMGEGLAILLAKRILQEEIQAWNPNVQDVVGEICNVIAGNLKRHLMPGLKLGLPTVVHGTEYEIGTSRMLPSHLEEFTCEGHLLRIRVGCEV